MQCGNNFGRTVDNCKADLEPWADKGVVFHVPQQIKERTPEAFDICDDDGLGMAAELRPRQLLDQFFERTNATVQGNEGIGALEHQAFSGVHVVGDDEFIGIAQYLFSLGEEARDDAGHVAARLQGCLRHLAH